MQNKEFQNPVTEALPETVLFDMDGVLVDSEGAMLESAIEALRGWGIEAKAEDFTPFIGAGEKGYLGGAAGVHGVAYDEGMVDAAYAIYKKKISERSIACPGAVTVLKELKRRGFKIAVCTSANRTKLSYNLAALGLSEDFFTATVTSVDIEHNKPAPDIYLKGAAVTDTPPSRCLVMEDAQNGILAAHRAGMRAVGVTTSFSAKTLRETVGPEFIIDDIIELLDNPLLQRRHIVSGS